MTYKYLVLVLLLGFKIQTGFSQKDNFRSGYPRSTVSEEEAKKLKTKVVNEYYDDKETSVKNKTTWAKWEGDYYKHGEFSSYYPDGKLKESATYHMGEIVGDYYFYYYPNGTKKLATKYYYNKNGREEGEAIIFDWETKNDKRVFTKSIMNFTNGKENGNYTLYYCDTINFDCNILKEKGAYKIFIETDGLITSKRIGEWRFYFENGELSKIGQYKDGKEIGIWKEYHKGGILKSEKEYDELKIGGEYITVRGERQIGPVGTWKTYHPNGQLENQIKYSSGYPEDGIVIYYHENGSVNLEMEYKNGVVHGSYKAYHPSGKIQTEGKIINGLFSPGEWIAYHENGVKAYRVEYKIVGNGNIKVGQELFFYENGNIQRSNEYSSTGELTKVSKLYFENGKVKIEIPIVMGNAEGYVKHYYSNGKLKRTEFHQDGLVIDVINYYDINGNEITNKGTLKKGYGTVNDYDELGNLVDVLKYKEGKLTDN
jgi:antitoxin component YwqK of YwqJK toxin-antitoxin module